MDKKIEIYRVSLQISLLFLVMLAVFFVVWLVPVWQIKYIQPVGDKNKFDYENAARTTLVQTLGGIFFCVTSFFTWRNLRNSEKIYQLTDDKQVTERFTKAIEMLASEHVEIRLGGIYTLERIAKDSKEDCESVMDILTAFIRTHSPNESIRGISNISNEEITIELSKGVSSEGQQFKVSHDIQAVLSVLSRRDSDLNNFELNLSETKLCNAYMSGLVLENADLRYVDLSHADLRGARLGFANLEGAKLNGANLDFASLESANLRGISWDGHTKWPSKEKLANVRAIPETLRQQLKLG
ncbi:pentapeptide repeat-containing protein [Leptothoe sp. LEGE 181152]|nr:pentapeptide repeat-containing protein [Leptothoe sp. LEGE 181152]